MSPQEGDSQPNCTSGSANQCGQPKIPVAGKTIESSQRAWWFSREPGQNDMGPGSTLWQKSYNRLLSSTLSPGKMRWMIEKGRESIEALTLQESPTSSNIAEHMSQAISCARRTPEEALQDRNDLTDRHEWAWSSKTSTWWTAWGANWRNVDLECKPRCSMGPMCTQWLGTLWCLDCQLTLDWLDYDCGCFLVSVCTHAIAKLNS